MEEVNKLKVLNRQILEIQAKLSKLKTESGQLALPCLSKVAFANDWMTLVCSIQKWKIYKFY